MLNTLCILSHFDILCTIAHTKDSIRGSDIITHFAYNLASVLASGEIINHPKVLVLVPYPVNYRI